MLKSLELICIKNGMGQVWSRKAKTWVNPEEFTAEQLSRACGYRTFTGCDRVALRLYSGSANCTLWPKVWGHQSVRVKP